MTDLAALTPKQLAEKVRGAFTAVQLSTTLFFDHLDSNDALAELVRRAEEAERLQAERDDLRTALEQIASLSPFMSPSTDGSVNKAPGIAREVLDRHPKAPA